MRTSLAWPLLRAVANAVEREGGDLHDVEALVKVWERAERRNGERADVIRREAREGSARLRKFHADRAERRVPSEVRGG